MLDSVSVGKKKNSTIVARVDEDTKRHISNAADRLDVSVTAYLLQLIQNDRDPLVLTIHLDPDMAEYIRRSKSDDETVSACVNRLLRAGGTT